MKRNTIGKIAVDLVDNFAGAGVGTRWNGEYNNGGKKYGPFHFAFLCDASWIFSIAACNLVLLIVLRYRTLYNANDSAWEA